ncbi:PSME3.2 family protein [Megaselia abdita]
MNTLEKVQDYKDTLIKKAEVLIEAGFPKKIVELNQLLSTELFSNRKFASVHSDLNIPVPDFIPIKEEDIDDGPIAKRSKTLEISGTKVMALSSGTVSCNEALCEMIKIVKPIIRELVEDSNLLKMWISFMIPKIEDGNNFGVSIQEDTLSEVQAVEAEAAAYFDQISRYFLSRAKVVTKVAKYPHIEDYRRAVVEFDEKECLTLWLILCEIRNRYSALHDIVTKNMEKLKKPRSCNTESLY